MPSSIRGDFTPLRLLDSDMLGRNAPALPAGGFQPILHHGERGYVEGHPTGFVATPGTVDSHLARGDRVARRLVNDLLATLALPNGFELAIQRDAADCRRFHLLSVARATGLPRLLTGTEFADSALVCPPTARASTWQSQFALTADGSTALGLVHDSANRHTPNLGPPDRLLLIKTDPTQTFANARNAVDVTPPAMHAWFPGTLRITNGRGFAEGPDGGGSGALTLWAGALDGSVWSQLALPTSGTNLTLRASHQSWRTSRDGGAMAFAAGASSNGAGIEDDVLAVTDITSTAPLTVRNLTRFAAPTPIAPFGTTTVGAGGSRADFSPDGTRLAFVTGIGDATLGTPHRLRVVRTDGSQAGAAPSPMATRFDAQVDFVGSVHFVTNTRVLFLAGSAGNACDWYAYDVVADTFTNVTRTATGSLTAPFTAGGTTGNVASHGTFTSDNGTYLYFVRGFGGVVQPQPLRNNLVAIHAGSLALRDITGNGFGSGGTAPDLYLAPLTTRVDFTPAPRVTVELQLRRVPGSGEAVFVAAQATGTAGLLHDCNVFAFDVENAGFARALTNNMATGALADVALINHLVVSPDGLHVAYAQRRGAVDAAEDVFTVPLGSGPPTRLTQHGAGTAVTDGSIAFVGGTLEGVVFSAGRGSTSIPLLDTYARWTRRDGQPVPFALSPHLLPAEQRAILILCASPTIQ